LIFREVLPGGLSISKPTGISITIQGYRVSCP
jgi:hypothetical protein